MSEESKPSKYLAGIRKDGTVEGHIVETHYLPCKGARGDDGFLRVIADGNGYDIETRITDETLTACGYVRADELEKLRASLARYEGQAEIATVVVRDGRIVLCTLKAPGLPDGAHDLFCLPPSRASEPQLFKRKCARCEEEFQCELPPGVGVVYCSHACAD